ncbi:amino acid--[acyl-carrier-protein] ligase [Teredinibacter haidensis]|uniref:amino acid--[acyl-carrier-protein] ligase n=1 Tax=Teredinibacter haidensis TaxID=2731755 RepID=UPI000949012D|nr:amino acid--[acyl-carrier-protein] ligase [Teredinibacter haidensis]
MCVQDTDILAAYSEFRNALTAAGLLIASDVNGVYGRSGVFEAIVDGLELLITREGAFQNAEVMRFPPVVSRSTYLATDHIENMPDLMGSVHSFKGDEKAKRQLVVDANKKAAWEERLLPTDVMLVPAACYPLYPAATGTLSDEGRVVDLKAFVFRNEPSDDPARMQCFRQREYVRLGSAEQAIEHRNQWLSRAEKMLLSLGLDVRSEAASDPFFGRTGKIMQAAQLEQELKFEIVVPICSKEKPTAITSCNYHLNHFGQTFKILLPNGEPAHTSCIGFGLERITLALLKAHGLNPELWPSEIKEQLAI